MHMIVLAVLLFWLLAVVVSVVIPTIAVTVAASFIGKKAELSEKDKFDLKVYFYLIGGVFWALVSFFTGEGIFNAILALLVWPVILLFPLFGALSTSTEWALFGAGIVIPFVSVQLIAIIKILKSV